MKKILKALTLILALTVLGTNTTYASPARISGTDRYATATAISTRAYKTSSHVVIANAHSYVDALPGSSLANALKAPILLATKDDIPSATLVELNRLKPREAYILGGEAVLSKTLESKLTHLGLKVTRLGGANRHATSELIYRTFAQLKPNAPVAFSVNEVDAVASGAYRKDAVGLIYINPITPSTFAANLTVEKTAIGGNARITEDLYTALGCSQRIGGSDRYDTAALLAEKSGYKKAFLVNSTAFIDAFTVGTLSFVEQSAILLTEKEAIPQRTRNYIEKNRISDITLIGGTNVLSDRLLEDKTPAPTPAPIKTGTPPVESYKPGDRSTYGYWNDANHYSTEILMSPEAIEKYNTAQIATAPSLTELANYSESVTGSSVTKAITSISSPIANRYSANGTYRGDSYYNQLKTNLNLNAIPKTVTVQFGFVVTRTLLRTYPTWDGSHDKGSTFIDYFNETAVYPWEEIAITHTSKDGKWVFATTYNYSGWIPVENVATTTKADMLKRARGKNFVIITERQITAGGKLLDMGTRLNLVKETANSYTVDLPLRGTSGELNTAPVTIAKSQASKGYLPYSKAMLIYQALKFYGEPYGWGGMYNTRDCSGFLLDSHRVFGLKLPRNSGQQGRESLGNRTWFSGLSGLNAYLSKLKTQPIGAGMYMPGHVMMYIGVDQSGTPYMMHQYAGHYEKGRYVSVRACLPTPVTIQMPSKTYLESIYAMVEFVQ